MGAILSTPKTPIEVRRKRIVPLFRANHTRFRPVDEKNRINAVPLLLLGCLYGKYKDDDFVDFFDKAIPLLVPQTHKGLDTYEIDVSTYKTHIGHPKFIEPFVLFYGDRLVHDARYNLHELVWQTLSRNPEYIKGLCYDSCTPLANLAVGLSLNIQEVLIDCFATAACFTTEDTSINPIPTLPSVFCTIVDDEGISLKELLYIIEESLLKNAIPDPFSVSTYTLKSAFEHLVKKDFLKYYTAYLASSAVDYIDAYFTESFGSFFISRLASQFLVSFQTLPSFFSFPLVTDNWQHLAALPFNSTYETFRAFDHPSTNGPAIGPLYNAAPAPR
ncbi:conserved fungal protein, implicated in vesicle trafficking or lipid metabolism [Schizosaccharomyces pombe]|uniref:Uncharacterized protein C1604.03c n=1 Tax=Schizosaccharomyces pombe (strain 972 / ATCC 24843) TaxID=284812 RepID=YG03_SCHPO|nr:uncharacterized protein SPBC1604.03c [Schizosaccharomyces pombe]O94369.1 RecName: Full=Uncharacterized protein C1604.03c [Schizosaccharomyces pombe 972h-]CAA22336.1 conserved fungal protein [Schizosaccharomyces pombe]|eukprot:NP_596637.1 uncharacterized protein SPBC1604.03c [Schizosaccharomyces pombe]